MEGKLCSVPFCHSTCSGKDHHPLVRILCEFPCNGSLPFQTHQGKLEDAITDAQANGWGMSDDVPEKGANCPKLPLMHWAAVLGKGRALKRLVEEGFSTKCINPGITALSLSMRHMLVSYAKCNEIPQAAAGFRSVADVLYKFDKNVEDQQGRIALNLACEQYVTALTQPGAECSFRKNVMMILLSLTDEKSDGVSLVNHADCDRNNSLHTLAQRDECAEFVDAMLAKGADPTLRNKQGKTPCEVAQSCGQHQVARRLFRATPLSASPMKRPGSPELAARDIAIAGLASVSQSSAMNSDVSLLVREQVKQHVANRHTQAVAPVVQITDNVRVVKSSYQAQMKGNVKPLWDVCSVDFAVMNQQTVPVEMGSRHPQPHLIPNGVRVQSSTSSTHLLPLNGDARGGSRGSYPYYDQAAASGHRQEISSPPPLLSGAICNGATMPVAGGVSPLTLRAELDDEQQMESESSSSSLSSDEADPMLEDELLFEEEDGFVVALKQLKSTLDAGALAAIVAAEVGRRQVDYDAAANQRQEAKIAHAQLLGQVRTARKRCDSIVVDMDEAKAQIVFLSEELEQRKRRCADLDHERQAIDSQYKLAQLQHMSCSHALEGIPLAFQMNIAFDEDAASGSESYPAGTSSHLPADVTTPFFDSASVSSTPVYQPTSFV